MNEFSFIQHYLAPLATSPSALALKDDAAVLDIPAGQQLVISKDALIAGVHFLGSETPEQIAQKALRVNLSDLAAMGATPLGYFLALMLPVSSDEAWLKRFAAGLKHDQEQYVLSLLGGDTTRTPGPLSISITALGLVPNDAALKRSGAREGDAIYVSGTIGDAALGLQCAQGKLPRDTFLESRYYLPEPRLALGTALRGVATACMDISDGLMQDLGHICEASKVGAVIEGAHLPVSSQAKAHNPKPEMLLAGGDDYELLFTAPMSAAQQIETLSNTLKLALTRIGQITRDNQVIARDASGNMISLTKQGFTHF